MSPKPSTSRSATSAPGPGVGEALASLRASHARVRAELGALLQDAGESPAAAPVVCGAAEELGATMRLLEARLDQLERSVEAAARKEEEEAVRVAEALSSSGNALQKFASRRVPRVGALFASLALDYRLAVTRLLVRVVPPGGGEVQLEAGLFRFGRPPAAPRRPASPGHRDVLRAAAGRSSLLVPACP